MYIYVYAIYCGIWRLIVTACKMKLGLCRDDTKASDIQAGQGDCKREAVAAGSWRPRAAVCVDEWFNWRSQQVSHVLHATDICAGL